MTRTRTRMKEPWLRLGVVMALFFGRDARADGPVEAADSTAWSANRALSQRFGIDVARKLVHGGEATGAVAARAEVLRGIERAAALGTEEGLLLLVQLLQDPHGTVRSDADVLLAVTRALAPYASKRTVSRALVDVVLNASSGSTRQPSEDRFELGVAGMGPGDPNRRERLELARETAAFALARTGDPQVFTALLTAARKVGGSEVAATRALTAFPPPTLALPPIVTPEVIALSVALDDLRARDSILDAAHAADRATRIAALRGLGALGERRGLPVLEASATDPDPAVREAATHALVDLESKEAPRAVRRLVEDDETARAGVALASRVAGDEVVGALAARVRVSSDPSIRKGAIVALGRHAEPSALAALSELLTDPALEGDVAEAVARTSAPGAWEVVARLLAEPARRRLGARMAALRGRVRPEAGVPDDVKRALHDLSRASEPRDRAAGLSALVLLVDLSPESGLADPDAKVRRAIAGATEPTRLDHARALAARSPVEKDPATRLLLARALVHMGEELHRTTRELEEDVRSGDVVAPLAALELARGADDEGRRGVSSLLRSLDPVVRGHAVRGLAASTRPWAIGLLAAQYQVEVDPGVRGAVVRALAERVSDEGVPVRAHVLESAALFDPEEGIRTIALRARMGLPPPERPQPDDMVWLRVTTAAGAPPPLAVTGVLVRADGLAIPVVFDDDGYCLTPAPQGPARLVLAPGLRTYEAPRHAD